MVQISTLFAASVVLSGLASAMPVQKRIAQVIADATADWEQACVRCIYVLVFTVY